MTDLLITTEHGLRNHIDPYPSISFVLAVHVAHVAWALVAKRDWFWYG